MSRAPASTPAPTPTPAPDTSPSPPHGVWAPSDNMQDTPPLSSAPAKVSSILTADYDSFTNYESCLPGSYSDHESYPPPSQSSSLAQTPPPPVADATRTTSTIAPRSLYGFVHDLSTARLKLDSPTAYNSTLDGPPYTPSNAMASSYSTEGSSFTPNFQSYMSDNNTQVWPRQDYEAPALYMSPQSHTPDSQQERRSVRLPRARRPARKHTTKEEANFQCEVKGCGKFFSRSYNFKSHMETHDEKREYPFPCTVEGCTKKFVRKTDLQRHHQSVHMKERNHKCDYCGRLFARKDTLRRHMEDGCSKRFDIGTLDLRGEGYGSADTASRSTRVEFSHLAASPATLPPITMSLKPANADAGTIGGSTWQR